MKVPALLAVLALSFCPCVLRAQSTNASLIGRVTDPSKAAINTGTNFQYGTPSNSHIPGKAKSENRRVFTDLDGGPGWT